MWSGIEYRAETVGWPVVTSQFGVLDICRLRKDAYYYYLQEWTSEPMVHIFPHWTWQNRDGESVCVWCYSNCDKVELELNGKSLGTKDTVPLTHLEWNVPYAPGTLAAYAYKDGARVCSDIIRTAGKATKIVLSVDRSSLKANGTDVAIVTAQIVDENGTVVPDACNKLAFEVQGQGKLLGISAGDPASHENERLDSIRAFNGLCIALVESGVEAGNLRVRTFSEGLESGTVEIDVI